MERYGTGSLGDLVYNSRLINPLDSLTPGVKKLLISNFVIWLATLYIPDQILRFLAFSFDNAVRNFMVWQFFTYAFVHIQGGHLFWNMLGLWFIGPHLEAQWGQKEFFRFYFLCVLGAAIVQVVVGPQSILLGASGGVFGLLVAFGMLFPNVTIYVFFVLPMRAIQVVILVAILAVAYSLSKAKGNVAHMAHLGGMLTAFIYLKYPVWIANFSLFRAKRIFANPRGRKNPSLDEDLKSKVDHILDKISAKGVESLSEEEHDIMQKYAKKKS